jgi:phosphopantothenoylcysteine decarboxylase/phosphopantothenate--cysteine ligase
MPIDLASGGTWIGFNEKGLMAMVVDQHTGEWWVSKRSRGKLMLDILLNYDSVDQALDHLEKELSRGIYKKGNFVLCDSSRLVHILYDNEIYRRDLPGGIHIFTNIMSTEGYRPKNYDETAYKACMTRFKRAQELTKNPPEKIGGIIDWLINIARDHQHGYTRYSICMHGEDWVTSSSTIIAYGEKPRLLYASGSPCKTSYIDYSHIIEGENELRIKSNKLLGKKIGLCLTGSVATIEAPKLARLIRRYGGEVKVFMTKYAVDYGVSPKVMEWASDEEVVIELSGKAEHISQYDAVIIYPATLNTINKIANGVADNAVTTLCAATAPNRLIIAPAMNLKLYNNPIFRNSVSRLKELGVNFIEPIYEEGAAKIAKPDEAIDYIIRAVKASRLSDRKVLILAGPTQYPIDPIRYISNRSTGRLGYWLAREAFQRGCKVTVIYGPGKVSMPRHTDVVDAITTEDMLRNAEKELSKEKHDIAIFAAAILDYKPRKFLDYKFRSGREWSIDLTPAPKVIAEIRRQFNDLFIVGFKLEYNVDKEALVKKAREELDSLGIEMVVANDLAKISHEIHSAILISREGGYREYVGDKEGLANAIFDFIEELYE